MALFLLIRFSLQTSSVESVMFNLLAIALHLIHCYMFFICTPADSDNQAFIAHSLRNFICSCSFNAKQFHNF